jgi:hypothetical protein
MPLRDHFHPPLADFASWEELHGAWPSTIAFRLNALLPRRYRSGVKVHLGSAIEVDVATFDGSPTLGPVTNGSQNESTEATWAPAQPALLLETDAPMPPEYEVRVYDEHRGRRLVAAVELVSPGNKDRPESRDAFVSKCHALLQQEVCVVIVDPVTAPHANLYAELAERVGAEAPALADASIYAVTCRCIRLDKRLRIEAWPHELEIGAPLPTLPLWLTDRLHVPLELESTYEATCQGLRIS